MKSRLQRLASPTSLLSLLIDRPDLARTVRSLPPRGFAALVRRVGVQDASELVALATTSQLVEAFDEDLFVNEAPGQREIFDVHRFIVWLEVILQAGDDVAAARIAALSEDFVTHALSHLVLVMDHDALRFRVATGGVEAHRADKVLESGLCEQLDDHLLVSLVEEGWDAALALILALDHDHRDLLERVLDRCSYVGNEYIDDLDALVDVLTEAESLAEDVEDQRDQRRARQGWVEPRAARAFLRLAVQPMDGPLDESSRDHLTRVYFRDLSDPPAGVAMKTSPSASPTPLLEILSQESPPALLTTGEDGGGRDDDPTADLIAAMQDLRTALPHLFDRRLSEIAYLANVLLAGADVNGRRMRAAEAAEKALHTVALGARLEAGERADLADVVRRVPADVLFRRGSRGTGPKDLTT